MSNVFADLHADSVSRPLTLGLPLTAPYHLPAHTAGLQLAACFPGSGREPLASRRARLFRMLDTLDEAARREMLLPVRTVADLALLQKTRAHAVMYSVEGGGFLPEDLPALFVRGVRVLSLVWDRNEFGASSRESGTDADDGLTPLGIGTLSACESLGLTIDVSHLSDASFRDVAAHTATPLLATHSNFRAVCPHPRNLTDEEARLIAARGGLIGLNLYPPFLSEQGSTPPGISRSAPSDVSKSAPPGASKNISLPSPRCATLDDLLRHVEHGLALCGEETLAFGFDIDGTGGAYPAGVSFSDSMHARVADVLLSHYSAATVDRIAGGNALRFFEARLGEGKIPSEC